jgi:hypothetical protein
MPLDNPLFELIIALRILKRPVFKWADIVAWFVIQHRSFQFVAFVRINKPALRGWPFKSSCVAITN